MVLRRDDGACLALLHEVEGATVGRHALLDGRGRRDAVAGLLGGRGLVVAEDVDAGVGVGPEAAAVAAGGAVPREEAGQRDAVVRGDGGARVARLHQVEVVAVVHHARLRWRRRLDAVARLRWRRLVPDHRHAGVRIGPQAAAVAAGIGVPLQELRERDAVGGSYGRAGLARLNQVELIAVLDEFGLRRKWRFDPFFFS